LFYSLKSYNGASKNLVFDWADFLLVADNVNSSQRNFIFGASTVLWGRELTRGIGFRTYSTLKLDICGSVS